MNKLLQNETKKRTKIHVKMMKQIQLMNQNERVSFLQPLRVLWILFLKQYLTLTAEYITRIQPTV